MFQKGTTIYVFINHSKYLLIKNFFIMKKFNHYLAWIAVFALFFTSCSKDEPAQNTTEKASLSFGAIVQDLATKSATKQASEVGDLPACSDDTPAYVEIVLMQGETAVVGTLADPFMVDLVDGQLFTEEVPELELAPGNYSLEHFSVYNDMGDLIWLAPKGGTLAGWVDSPLPLSISLGAGVKKYVDVSVLCYDDRNVNEYGYLFFELDANKAFEFCFFANYCTPEGRHFPALYSVDISIDGEPVYTGEMNTVDFYDDGQPYAEPLCLALPDLAEYADDEAYIDYSITLLDWDGVYDAADMAPITGSLSRNDVMANFDGDDNVDYMHVRFNCGDTPPDDDDGDGVPNDEDICPGFDDNIDTDGDGVPDGCDICAGFDDSIDTDGDGVPDGCDICAGFDDSVDTDGDGVPDGCDICAGFDDSVDTDGDGVPDGCDICAGFDDSIDTDGDGVPDGCDEEDEGDVLEKCETAIMFGDNTWIDLGLTNSRWGWTEHFTNEGDGEYVYKIWAGAAQNDIEKGYYVGKVILNVDGDDITLEIVPFTGNQFDDIAVYFGDEAQTSIAAGQYDNTDGDGLYYVEGDDFEPVGNDFWFTVHIGEACPSRE